MKLHFTKMHGLGNDFMVIDGINQTIPLSKERIQQLSDRHFGVGFDQLLLVERPHSPDNDFRYRIFNNDGGEVEQCGNGARCFAKFVFDQGMTVKSRIQVETTKGVIFPEYLGNNQVRVDMGRPKFTPNEIPFQAEHEAVCHDLQVGDALLSVSVISIGNPHVVQIVDNVALASVTVVGSAIEKHPRFPERVNAGFMQIMGRDEIRLRVFERCSGETLACGTGACAAAVAGIRRGLLDRCVRVNTRGGELIVEWAFDDSTVTMIGPAATVFQGTIEI